MNILPGKYIIYLGQNPYPRRLKSIPLEDDDVPFTDEFRKFMWEKHRDTYTLILLGHIELITNELVEEFKNYKEE